MEILFSSVCNISTLFLRTPSITIPRLGATWMNTTLLRGWVALTNKRQSYQLIGKQNSPKSVSVWRTAKKLTSSSLQRRQTRCIPWSPMGNTAQPCWVVTIGSHCLTLAPHFNANATRKGSTLFARVLDMTKNRLRLESVSWVTMDLIHTVIVVIPGLVLEPQVILMTPTLVETWQAGDQIMATITSKLWDTFLFSDIRITCRSTKTHMKHFL